MGQFDVRLSSHATMDELIVTTQRAVVASNKRWSIWPAMRLPSVPFPAHRPGASLAAMQSLTDTRAQTEAAGLSLHLLLAAAGRRGEMGAEAAVQECGGRLLVRSDARVCRACKATLPTVGVSSAAVATNLLRLTTRPTTRGCWSRGEADVCARGSASDVALQQAIFSTEQVQLYACWPLQRQQLAYPLPMNSVCG